MAKVFDFLFSMQLAGILMLVFAGVIGAATFVENDLGTTAARILVYDTHWFEILLILMAICIIGSIVKNKLFDRKKYTTIIFHIAFVIILIGSGITRYFGEEGMIRIREGEASNLITSQYTYIQVNVDNGSDHYYFSFKELFNPHKKNKLHKTLHFNNEHCELSLVRYVPNATETIIEDPAGESIISLAILNESGMETRFIRKGESVLIGSLYFSYDHGDGDTSHVRITKNGDGYFFISPVEAADTQMSDTATSLLEANIPHPFESRKIYSFGDTRLVIQRIFDHAVTRLVEGSDKPDVNVNDAVIFNLSYHNKNQQLAVFGRENAIGKPSTLTIDGVKFSLTYGPKFIEIPFSLFLKDFKLERYPGSNSPSSYLSEVTLIDPRYNIEEHREIFMNNVLSYNGYRFFQSSYDQDEKGTILSVNHDYWGTFVTYIGYFLMVAGMLFNFFLKNSRFRNLIKSYASTKRTALSLLFVMTGILSSNHIQAQFMTIDPDHYIDQDHARDFGKLLILDQQGRIEPINTFSSEIIRKITKKSRFMGLNPEQVLLGMIVDPITWKSIPMIKVSHNEIKRILGARGRYASFDNFIDYNNGGSYKLYKYVEAAYKKEPGMRTGFDKEIIKVDERANICYMVYLGNYLRIFPLKDDEHKGWYTFQDSIRFDSRDRAFINKIFPDYLNAISNGLHSRNWAEAKLYLDQIKSFQQNSGSRNFHTKAKTSLEILYNDLNIFKRLFPYYSLIGFIMLILLFSGILSQKSKFKKIIRIGITLIIIGFALQTTGLSIRWYISGHAPWSNGYESMIYISWATVLAGLFFIKKSKITVASTAILASLTLMVANLSWMDPEITNLVPVLKSYWLVIHVAVVTASYSFLAIGCLLGFINLVLMIFKNPVNKERINSTIRELTIINEMNLIIGGFLIITGTFLGAVWANESWGRYWGWDPKETWALVTVVIYAFVLHMRVIPGLKGTFAFNFAALISFSSVLMTYFGVNYYLSGLHSYASGDAFPVPVFAYYAVFIVAIISTWAYINENKFIKKMTD